MRDDSRGCGDGVGVRHERLTEDEASAGLPKISILFAAGGEVATNPGKHLSTGQSAEATRDFLLHLDHADVLLALVVGEGHVGVQEEGQHTQIVILQAVEQVGSLVLLGAGMAQAAAGE